MTAVSASVFGLRASEIQPGSELIIKVVTTSGATPTLSLGSLGATVPIIDEYGNVPAAGFLVAGVTYFGQYDGTSVIIRGGSGDASVAIAATSDGLTTGIIPQGAKFLAFTSASSANFVQIGFAGIIGMRIRGWVGANGFKLSTKSGLTETINNVNSALATAAAVIPANRQLELQCVAASTWLLTTLTNLGAVATAIVPS